MATAAAEQLARAMALELAPIRCNAVAPGWTDTPMWDAILGAAKADVFQSVAEKLPIRRLARPDDVARAVLFLMASEAITGEVVHVDGGGRLV
ncbi:MAG: SDR family oxidoreductase [Myxococcales bacterium]|nr:SDR family oxidoreductase [Myxococcales bacterium]